MRTIAAGALLALALGCSSPKVPVRMRVLETSRSEWVVRLTDAHAGFACEVDLDLARRAAEKGLPMERSFIEGVAYAQGGKELVWYRRGSSFFDQLIDTAELGEQCVNLARAMKKTVAGIPTGAQVYRAVSDTTVEVPRYQHP